MGYVPASGRRKPSTLRDAREEEGGVEVKPEPGEGDIQFARLIGRTVQAEGGEEEVGGEEKKKKEECQQPLTNDLTLAVAMDVDAMIRKEKEEVEELAGAVRLEDPTREDVKADPDEPEEGVVKRETALPAQISVAR